MSEQSAPAMKTFHIGDILSVTTGRLVSPRHIEGVYDILNHLTADNLMTHQLPRASRECEPFLRERFPDLAAIEPPAEFRDEAHVRSWLAELVAIHGETRSVEPMRDGVHEYRDPVAEMREMAGDRPVVVLDPSDPALSA